ncbi:MAG: tetratricopeptide repeat protein [Pseudobdellovibrio sp.]
MNTTQLHLIKLVFLSFVSFCVFSCASTDANYSSDEADAVVKTSPTMNSGAAQAQLKKSMEQDGLRPIDTENRPVSKSLSDKLHEAIKSQNDDAIKSVATEVLTQNSKDAKALNALAMVHFKKNELEAAEYLLNKAILAHSQQSELYNNLGLIKLAKDEKREAIMIFRKGLEVNTQDMILGANLGSLYLDEKDYQKAELALEIPYKKGTKDIKILGNYAVALAANGKAAKAADLYEKLLKDNPGQRDLMFNYSVTLIKHLQKYKEGLDILNRLKFVGAPSEVRNVIKDLESIAKAGLK